MADYRVRWEIDVTADTPQEAAIIARRIQLDTDSTATVFEIRHMVAKLPTKAQKAAVVCALVGHSRVVEVCFGQVTCARCEAILGDVLAGAYDLSQKVIISSGHSDCEECRKAYGNMTWRSKYMAKNPFPVKAKAEEPEVTP